MRYVLSELMVIGSKSYWVTMYSFRNQKTAVTAQQLLEYEMGKPARVDREY